MATTTVSITSTTPLQGSKSLFVGTITITGNYVVGGETLTFPAGQKAERFDTLITDNAGGYLTRWDTTNQKLMVFQGDNTNAAAAPAIQLGAVSLAGATGINFIAIGD